MVCIGKYNLFKKWIEVVIVLNGLVVFFFLLGCGVKLLIIFLLMLWLCCLCLSDLIEYEWVEEVFEWIIFLNFFIVNFWEGCFFVFYKF